MELTKRTEEIIRILLSFSEDHPVSTSLISEKLGISTRSVQREMLYVEEWLESQGFVLNRKRGSGLSLAATEEEKQNLLAILDQNPDSEQYIYDREHRQWQLRFELLMADGPLKTYYLTDKCDVSEGTLLNDLNQITPWFRSYNILLVRRTGLGVFIQGEELSIRRALTTTICHIILETEDLGKHDRENVYNHSQFVKEFDPNITAKVNEILLDCEQHMNVRFSDNGYLNLLVYITLSIHHIQKGRTITVDIEEQNSLLIQPEYGVSERLADQLRLALGITLSKDEICGIATQFASTRSFPNKEKDLTRTRDLNIHQIVISIIKQVSDLTMIDFTKDSSLSNDLSIHLQPTIGRLRANIPIDNPLLENLKSDYPDIFDACQKACSNVLGTLFSLKELPQSEVGFITMHFGAAMERKEKNDRLIRVVIVCPTGIGSSRLLAADLHLAYPFLDIVGTRSAFDIDQRELLQNGIDLIISTVKLETSFRYVQVNTILSKHDKALINNRIEYLLRQKKTDPVPVFVPTNNIKQSDVNYISTLGDTIYDILEQLTIHSAPIIHNREELIQYASTICLEDPDLYNEVYMILKERDTLGDTYIKPFHALLLHGRTDLVEHPTFSYIRLEPPFYESGKVILGAIVSLIPYSGLMNKVSAAITSQMIGSLLDNNQLLAAMRADNIGLLHNLMEHELLDFYRRHVAEILDIPFEG